MTTKDDGLPIIDRDLIIDRIYGIAMEPTSLDDFIELWHDMNLAAHFGGETAETSGPSDSPYLSHLERAHAIMQRNDDLRPDLMEYLRPYDNLAAFVVSGSLRVEAANQGALSAFAATRGGSLDQLSLPPQLRNALVRTARDVLHGTDHSEKILKADITTKGSSILFRIMRVAGPPEDGPTALVVSSRFHWRKEIGALLGEVYQLTQAEQDVVRMLVEGQETKSIAAARTTSEGTVRAQIKSITGKMNLRSQTDIVRFAMALGDFPKTPAAETEAVSPQTPGLTNNWLESEVWKPFKSLTMPDGRRMTYHDMGPSTGNPAVFSHMGSCMVRWPRSMIRLAFELNLRVICPIRAGYGHSDTIELTADPLDTASTDTAVLLNTLGIQRVPYVAQGSDFPFAVDLVAKHPDLVSEVLGFGARPCLPGGLQVNGAGRWQRFFVTTARNSPHLAQFASHAVMAMCKRIGPDAMLRQLCKDSPADLALLENEEIRRVLAANLSLMAGKSTNAARAFAMEYIAFQADWSDLVMATRPIPVQLFLAQEDPTIDLNAIPKFQQSYPWIAFEVVQDAGLALTFQHPEKLIPLMAKAASRAA
jgi:DNA-binding CsgD family transcriptional regulator/pimeloyl-ACP methyl ester carboxylesterase